MTFTTTSGITSGGSVIPTNILVSSQPPPSTIYNSPNWKSNNASDDHSTLIGGIVGGVVGFLVLAGIALIVWRRRKHREDEDALEYENQVRNEFGRRLELEFDDDDEAGGQGVSKSHL